MELTFRQHFLGYCLLKFIFERIFVSAGLTESTCDLVNFRHVTAMADYALQLFNKIEEVNEHSFNNFRMRIGMFYHI